jgi:3-hydroxymyristoyl/3-hydroxydecanoyl-(acyl carrier protein) dehydratase
LSEEINLFEFIQSISINVEERKSCGVAYVPDDIPLFQDHFPGVPILPGTFLIELATQVAGLLAEEVSKKQFGMEKWALLGMIRYAKLLEPVHLPATLMIMSDLKRLELSNALLTVQASQNECKKLQAEVVMMMTDSSPDWEKAIEARHHRLKRWR